MTGKYSNVSSRMLLGPSGSIIVVPLLLWLYALTPLKGGVPLKIQGGRMVQILVFNSKPSGTCEMNILCKIKNQA